MRQLLVPVEEQLYTAKTRLLWLELESPFYVLRRLRGRIERGDRAVTGGCFAVTDFGGDFVGRDTCAYMSVRGCAFGQPKYNIPFPPGHVLMMSMSSGVAL